MLHCLLALMTDIDVLQPLSLLSAEQREEFELLLQPISEYYPSGPPIRFNPIFTEIRLAREEDDPNLPMGVWERPLKRADWPMIAMRCKVILSRYAKDLQIAAWLTEAWSRQHGMGGFLHGLLVVDGLCKRFWETVHPQIDEDGDAELRVAPLEWLNRSLSMTIRIMVPLTGRGAGQVDRLTLADWERMSGDKVASARQDNGQGPGEESGVARQTLSSAVDGAKANPGVDVDHDLNLVRASLATVLSIESFTGARLGADAPAMSALRDALRAIERALLEMSAPWQPEIAPGQNTAPVPGQASSEAAQPKREETGDAVGSNDALSGLAQPDVADQLSRQIDAICEAAGVHEPSGSERLMAMQIGLLCDQNAMLQSVASAQARQAGGQASGDSTSAEFTALVRTILSRKVAMR
jgi:type VI secretion system protein ImpA